MTSQTVWNILHFIGINKRPQISELCNSCKQKVLNTQVPDCLGANIIRMAKCLRSNIVDLVCNNALDSKNNIAPANLPVEAGGKGNCECTHPMLQPLTSTRAEVQQVTHLNKKEKDKVLSKKDFGWENILDKMEEPRCNVADVFWSPACNINNSQTSPKGHGANLTQCKHNRNQHEKLQCDNKGQQWNQSSKKKINEQSENSWKTERPKKCQLKKTVNGIPIHSCAEDGRKNWWCNKCGPKGGWTMSHHTGENNTNFSFEKKSKKKGPKSHGEVNLGEGPARILV